VIPKEKHHVKTENQEKESLKHIKNIETKII
jgi:hypothetical protein